MSKIIAHRGFSSMAPDNSLLAIEKAIEASYIDGIEIDVRMTKDNKLVLIHDKDIKEVSNGMGNVSDYTLEELNKYDFHSNIIDRRLNYIKSFFEPNGHKIRLRIKEFRKNVTKLSTLESIIKLFDNDKMLLIELKKEDNDYDEYLSQLISILNSNKNKNLYIQSFNINLIKILKERCTYVKVGILISSNRKTYDYNDFDFISIKHKLVSKEFYNRVVTNGHKELMIWTVDSKYQIDRLKRKIGKLDKNIYIITNYPDYIHELKD